MIKFPNDLQDQQMLQRITRGVYLMRSTNEQTLWRLGLIGAGGRLDQQPSDRNNAYKRLRQVSGTWRVGDHMTPAEFQFQMIAWTPEASKRQIRSLEKAVRSVVRDGFGLPAYQNDLSVRRYVDGLCALANPKDSFVLADEMAEQLIAAVILELQQAL